MTREECKYSNPIQQTIYLDGYKDGIEAATKAVKEAAMFNTVPVEIEGKEAPWIDAEPFWNAVEVLTESPNVARNSDGTPITGQSSKIPTK